jgi:hypothetical protein
MGGGRDVFMAGGRHFIITMAGRILSLRSSLMCGEFKSETLKMQSLQVFVELHLRHKTVQYETRCGIYSEC